MGSIGKRWTKQGSLSSVTQRAMITKHHNYNGLITKQRAMITEQGSINYTGSLSRVTQTHDDLASPVCTYRPPAPNTLHASLTDARIHLQLQLWLQDARLIPVQCDKGTITLAFPAIHHRRYVPFRGPTDDIPGLAGKQPALLTYVAAQSSFSSTWPSLLTRDVYTFVGRHAIWWLSFCIR